MTGCYNNGLNSYQKWGIGNDIRTILLQDADILEQVGQSIYPLVAPENTKGDFILYRRDRYFKQDNKMGVHEDDCTLSVVAVSDNYDSVIALASKIDNALTGKQFTDKDSGHSIRIHLTDSSEDYSDLKYIETLTFTIK